MSNKKRIAKKISSIEKRNFKRDLKVTICTLNNLSSFSDQCVESLNHLCDSFAYFVNGIQASVRTVRTFNEYYFGIDFAGGNCKKLDHKNAPSVLTFPLEYRNDFWQLRKVGFSRIEAFETLKETYNF